MSNAESEGSSYCLGDTCGICEHIFCVMPLTKEGLQAKITGSLPDHPGFMVSDCEICGFHQETSIDDLKKYRISPDGSFEELGGATEIVILSASDNWSDSVLPMPVLNHKRIYEPVGRCIYCGATRHSKNRVKLGGEHIIP